MNYLFKIQEKIVPEMITLAEIRYTILRNVYYNQPIGRRALTEKLASSERTVRKEMDFLADKGWIDISKAGARMTPAGEDFLIELDKYIKEIRDIKLLEERLKIVLKLKDVMVVPGELEYATVKQEIGRFTARMVNEMLEENDVLAVTGGETLAQVANSMPFYGKSKNVMVVPGRGGLGEEVEIQANTIAATIAKKIGGSYRLLQVPDNISKDNLAVITAEPSIQKTLQILKRVDILLHGVGSAEEMASRRGMNEEQIDQLLAEGAIGEAFGFYFNQQGEIVHSTTSVGIGLEDLERIDRVIAVAGGTDKARAIIAAVSPRYQDLLITDELTAKEILNLKGGEA